MWRLFHLLVPILLSLYYSGVLLGQEKYIVIFGPVRHHGPIIISLGNFSKFPKGKPFYIENTVGKTSKGEQIHSDVIVRTRFLWWWPLGFPHPLLYAQID